MRAIIIPVIAAMFVAGCTDSERPLHDLNTGFNGPDEFSVIPARPLEDPDTLVLPEPTPGGTNRADTTPQNDAVIALGGSPAATDSTGVPASDAALVTAAGRYGTDAQIRATLAAEDEALRERKRRTNFFNPLGRGRYFPAYANQALDAYAELERLIALGVIVPNTPAAQ